MVFFTCGACGESIQKPKVKKHLTFCKTQALTCIDCNTEFTRVSFNTHNKCVTEDERYGGKDYVAKDSKGDAKQKAWLASITSAMQATTLSPSASKIWKSLESGGFENIPRKNSKFVNFLQNSMRISDRSAIDEIWSIFEKSFHDQNVKTPEKKTPKKETMKFSGEKPWWQQMASKAGASSSESSESEDEGAKAAEVPQMEVRTEIEGPANNVQTTKTPKKNKVKKSKEPIAETNEAEDLTPTETPSKKKKAKNSKEQKPALEEVAETVTEVQNTVESNVGGDETPLKTPKKKKKKKANIVEEQQGATTNDVAKPTAESNEAEVVTPEETPKKKKKKAKKVEEQHETTLNNVTKPTAESNKAEVATPEETPKKKKKKAKKVEEKHLSLELEEPKNQQEVSPEDVLQEGAESNEAEVVALVEKPKKKKKKAKKVEEQHPTLELEEPSAEIEKTENVNEAEDEPLMEAPKKKKKKKNKKVEEQFSPVDGAAESNENVEISVEAGEVVNSVPVETPKKRKKKATKTEDAKTLSKAEMEAISRTLLEVAEASLPAIDNVEEEIPKKKKKNKKNKKPKNVDEQDVEKDEKMEVELESVSDQAVNGTQNGAIEISEDGSSTSSDEEPVKKVPLKKISKPTDKTDGKNKKREIKYMENDYRDEKDQRTIFVKNLPFSTSLDDLWDTFAKSDTDVMDCRLVIDRNTGNHKGLAFIEYSTKLLAEEALLERWTVNDRIANVTRAGLKKPEGKPTNKPAGNPDERDRRTLFVKGLPYSSEPEEIQELFGSIAARILRDYEGNSKGIAFVEFNNETEALSAYNHEDGYELGGRWLQVDKLKPRSEMVAGNRQNDKRKSANNNVVNDNAKRPKFNKWAGLAPKNAADDNSGGKKTTFEDSD